MRLALAIADRPDAVDVAVAADRAGLAAVALHPSETAAALAAAIAAATEDARLLVPVRLGSDNPTTLAEELSVVDQISGGRVVAVIDRGALSDADAADDLGVLAAAWSGRWVDLPARWRGDRAVRVAVTPAPAQLALPMWSAGAELGTLPRLVDADADPAAIGAAPGVRATVTGELEADRAEVVRLADAGASLAIVTAPEGIEIERYVARYLVPEAAMPHFPRIVADSAWPASYQPQ